MTTTQTSKQTAKPSHRLFLVTGHSKSASWREIGAAWPNRDGMGFSLTCEAMPLQGRIVMRKVISKPAGAQQADREGGR